jgi:hypothetical protein
MATVADIVDAALEADDAVVDPTRRRCTRTRASNSRTAELTMPNYEARRVAGL